MGTTVMDDHERHLSLVIIAGIILASIGLLFLCVGVGTPSWHIDYDSSGIVPQWYTNFYYTCYAVNGTCWNNQNLLSSGVSYYGQPITQATAVSTDYYLRLRNAAALAILGLLFLFFGLVAIVLLIIPSLRFIQFNGRLNLIAALLLAIAGLFQRAALSEGQHQLSVNGYSGNLYQTGHALTIVAIPICAYVAGRLYVP